MSRRQPVKNSMFRHLPAHEFRAISLLPAQDLDDTKLLLKLHLIQSNDQTDALTEKTLVKFNSRRCYYGKFCRSSGRKLLNTAIEDSVVKQVVDVTDDYVTIDVGLKSEGRVPLASALVGMLKSKLVTALKFMLNVWKRRWRGLWQNPREEAWILLENAFEAQERVTGVIFNGSGRLHC